MILAFIEMTVFPAKRKELMQTIHALIPKIRQEKGCIKCSACQDIENENTFHLIEEWKSQADFDNYLSSDIFDVLLGTKNFMSEPFKINFKTVSPTSIIEAVEQARGNKC